MSATNDDPKGFTYGVLAALGALKAAIQASPGFNQDALEEIVQFLVDHPPKGVDSAEYSKPLNILLGDQSSLLQGNGIGRGPKPRH